MRICIINGDFKMGGQQKISWYLGKKLSNTHEVFFYSFYPAKSNFDFKDLNLTVDYSKNDIKTINKISRKIFRKITVPKTEKEFSKRLNTFIEYLLYNRIEILISSGGFLTSLSKEIKKRIPNLKIIAWQHNTAEIYLNNYYKDIKNSYIEGLNYSDVVVCLTQEDAAVFSKYNKNTTSIDNMLTISSRGDISDLKSKTVIFISRYSIESKGIDLFLEVVKLLPNDINVLFGGSGTKKEIHKVRKMISDRDLEDRIVLKGKLDEAGIISLYKQGSVFISTSRWEGFGIVMSEAMEFGLPVIAFDTRGARRIIGQNEYGKIIGNLNINEMAKNIEYVLNNDDVKKQYGELSKERALRFSPEKIVNEWIDLIQALSK